MNIPKAWSITVATMVGGVGLFVSDTFWTTTKTAHFMTQAEARIGRPLTPFSVAGVARRTTRRAVWTGAIAGGAYGYGYGYPYGYASYGSGYAYPSYGYGYSSDYSYPSYDSGYGSGYSYGSYSSGYGYPNYGYRYAYPYYRASYGYYRPWGRRWW